MAAACMLGEMKHGPSFFFVGVVIAIVACHGGVRPRTPDPEGQTRARAGGRCPPSGIRAGGTCPKVKVAHVDASSSDGCKSDAECGTSGEARCVENPSFVPERHPSYSARTHGNLLGEAPRPPASTICVYDACQSDADCSGKNGCLCGSGEGADRNRCIALDACESDADCGKGLRCECDRSGPNYCYPTNCDTDAECGAFSCAESSTGGRYCHTARDTCKVDAECPPVPSFQSKCGYDVGEGVWACRKVDYPPPG